MISVTHRVSGVWEGREHRSAALRGTALCCADCDCDCVTAPQCDFVVASFVCSFARGR